MTETSSWHVGRPGRHAGPDPLTVDNDLDTLAVPPMISWGYHIAPARVHGRAVAVVAPLLHRWVTGPDRYTEVAETLAIGVAAVVDTPTPQSPAAAWAWVADADLHPGGADARRAEALYLYLMSQSDTFSTDYASDLSAQQH